MNRSLPHGVGVVRERYTYLAVALLLCVTAFHVSSAGAAETRDRYYAHAAVLDEQGVIAAVVHGAQWPARLPHPHCRGDAEAVPVDESRQLE